MEAQINRLGINGEGIFNIGNGVDKGKVAFVDFALPEEIVDVDIIKSNSKYCRCILNKIITTSKERVEPRCKYFGKCGGCDIQHFDNDLQIKFKEKKILDVVSKIDNNIDRVEIVRKNNFGYRNKMVFPFAYVNGKIVIGMFEKNSHNIVNVDKCMLASENINNILTITKKYFDANSKIYDDIKDKMQLKYLVVREMQGQIIVSIVCSAKYDFIEYYNILKSAYCNIGLSIVVNKSNDEILAGEYIPEYGNVIIKANEFGIDYDVDIMSFVQVNNEIKKELYSKILSFVNEDDVVIDAFSGAGLLSAIVAKKCKQVVGIEINKFASSNADKLVKRNNIVNLTNICGDANLVLKDICKKYNNSTLILDPARQGCGDGINRFLSENVDFLPKQIVYVSCNLATLSRDLNFIKNNYSITYACGYDMFPNTKHIETLVCLQRQAER